MAIDTDFSKWKNLLLNILSRFQHTCVSYDTQLVLNIYWASYDDVYHFHDDLNVVDDDDNDDVFNDDDNDDIEYSSGKVRRLLHHHQCLCSGQNSQVWSDSTIANSIFAIIAVMMITIMMMIVVDYDDDDDSGDDMMMMMMMQQVQR